MKKLAFLITWLIAARMPVFGQQDGGPEGASGRVRYALILPEEKAPELVKETENNPFESNAVGPRQEENTEENQVRDILMRLPAVGGASGSQGMRVMLGGMRLSEGSIVPSVLPDQQVTLQVKSISSTAVELIWVDKKSSHLPPKILTIPLDLGAKVRRQLPGQRTKGAPQASLGTIRRDGVPILSSPSEMGLPTAGERSVTVRPALPVTPHEGPREETIERAVAVADPAAAPPAEQPLPTPPAEVPPAPPAKEALAASAPAAPEPSPASPPPAPLPPPADLPEASVMRMLFGNHAPAGK